MKNILALLLVPLLLMTPIAAYAQEDIVIEELPLDDSSEELEGDAGVTPDSALWGIEVALDRIRLALARGPNKARLGLEIAEERLLELQAMAEAGKLDAADKAEEEHARNLERVRVEVDELGEGENGDEISDIEARVDSHLDALARLKERIERNDNIPEEAKARLRAKLTNTDGNVEELRVKIENKQDRFRIKRVAEGAEEKLEVKAKGRLTPDQKLMIRELAASIEDSGSKAKVKIECRLSSNGRNKDTSTRCKSKVRGDLTEDQLSLVDDLLESIRENGSRVKIEIKYVIELDDDDEEDESETEIEIEDESEEEDESEDEAEDEDESDDEEDEDESDDDDEEDEDESEGEDDEDESDDDDEEESDRDSTE